MQSRVQKWGNSLAVRIPKAYALEVGLGPDDPVDVKVLEGRLVVEPTRARSYSLEGLLSKVTKRNVHAAVDFGPAVGREAW